MAAIGGEVYSDVGDELIALWPHAHGIESARCVHCYLAIQEHRRRIDQMAKTLDCDRLISGKSLSRPDLPPALAAEPLGPTLLTAKRTPCAPIHRDQLSKPPRRASIIPTVWPGASAIGSR